MEEFLSKLTEYMTAAEQALVAHSPQVWETTLWVIRVEALYTLSLALIAILYSVGHTVLCLRVLWPYLEKYDLTGFKGNLYFAILFIGGILNIIALFAGIINALKFKVWLALANPEAAILYNLLRETGVM